MPSVSIIIPAYNNATLTVGCLERVTRSSAEEIVVVDDASVDSTPALLPKFEPRIRVIRHARNIGFARSCNDGAAASTGDYLLFLNNDTLPEPGWLEALLDYAESHPLAAIVGAKLVYPDQTIQHAGVVICQDRYPRHLYSGFPSDHPAVNRSRAFQIVTAACALVRRPVFEASGGFDARFQNGFEDVDLCLRLGKTGHQIHYCAESQVTHLESVSEGRHRHDQHNITLYRERWMPAVRPDDLDYYLADRLLSFHYEGRYPLILRASPLLASLDWQDRESETEHVLREQNRHIAGLLRENTELSLALEDRADDSQTKQYRRLREEICEAVDRMLPAGATVLVISKGDNALIDLPPCRGWHFPQTEHGAYAGHHPADSREAIDQLECLRARGAEYLLIPSTALWWLEHYDGFRSHLEVSYQRLPAPPQIGQLFALLAEDKEQVLGEP